MTNKMNYFYSSESGDFDIGHDGDTILQDSKSYNLRDSEIFSEEVKQKLENSISSLLSGYWKISTYYDNNRLFVNGVEDELTVMLRLLGNEIVIAYLNLPATRTGCGTKLINMLKNFCSEHSISGITVENPIGDIAEYFYPKLGFEPVMSKIGYLSEELYVSSYKYKV